MKEFISNFIDLIRSIIFALAEVSFIGGAIYGLTINKINESIAFGVIAICFILLEMGNELVT